MVHPNCAFSVRLKQAMPREKAVMGICLSISKSNEVSARLLLTNVNYRGSILFRSVIKQKTPKLCLEVKISVIMCNLLVYDYPS